MELFTFQKSRPVWVSFENGTGKQGKGGLENNGAKGHPFEYFAAGEEKVLCDLEGPGVVRRIWFTLNDRGREMLSQVYLCAYWDGEETPSVYAPVGDFFCMGNGHMLPFENELFASPEGRSFLCTVPMPFQKRARLTLKNLSGKDNTHLFYDVNLTREALPPETLYFHAVHTVTTHGELGKDIPILPEVRGRGRFLGMSLSLTVNREYGDSWWGEGEVKVYLEGESTPSLVGTGTEDYLGTAWGQGEFINHRQGCTRNQGDEVSFYRLHTADPIFFEKGCRVELQAIGGCSKAQARRLMESGAEMIPVAADLGGRMVHLYQRDWNWEQLPEEAFITFYRRDSFASTAYYYLAP